MKLSVSGIDFAYRSTPILENVTFGVHPGEVLCILGVNGAGKSTLLKCINRILHPKRGSVLVDGNAINHIPQREVARHMGYVPQKHPETQLTVYETVLMGRRPHVQWSLHDGDYALVEQVLDQLGLNQLAMRPINSLSGGQLQKVIIARALAQSPSVLLLDEPISNLDLKNQIDVMQLVQGVTRAEKLAAVVTIHDLNMALRFGDKFLFLKDQKVQAITDRSGFTPDLVELVYEVPVSLHQCNGHPMVVPA
ncbi:MAG: ABC transporter ATP-binding protein [Brachymonas sp.]|jgi:iron complex transport system ATP-binding protein|nr:ABC transporter ATP-binding protein [Brachymonas sp.]